MSSLRSDQVDGVESSAEVDWVLERSKERRQLKEEGWQERMQSSSEGFYFLNEIRSKFISFE